jgi:hypothetical protein
MNIKKWVQKHGFLTGILASVAFLIAYSIIQNSSFPYSNSGGYSKAGSGAFGADRSPYAFTESVSYSDDYSSYNSRSSIPIVPPEPDAGIAPNAEERHIIRNGELDVTVASIEETQLQIAQLTNSIKGFVLESRVYNESRLYEWQQGNTGSMQIRVPSASFDTILEQIAQMVIKVNSQVIRAQDATKQVLDSEVRLENLRAEEEQYRQILKKAVKIEDVLKTTEYINRVRNQIEQAETQLASIKDRVAYSTLTISFADEGELEILGFQWSPINTFKRSLRVALENLTNLAEIIIEVAVNIPAILISLVLLLFTWKGAKKGWGWAKNTILK